MALDFAKDKIEVRYNSADYGPFTFDLQQVLPSGVTISDVTIRSFLGKYDQKDDLGDATETTSELVDAVKSGVSGSYGVAVYFNYPSTLTYRNTDHTLVFEVTMSNNGTHNYYFQRAYVTNEGTS